VDANHPAPVQLSSEQQTNLASLRVPGVSKKEALRWLKDHMAKLDPRSPERGEILRQLSLPQTVAALNHDERKQLARLLLRHSAPTWFKGGTKRGGVSVPVNLTWLSERERIGLISVPVRLEITRNLLLGLCEHAEGNLYEASPDLFAALLKHNVRALARQGVSVSDLRALQAILDRLVQAEGRNLLFHPHESRSQIHKAASSELKRCLDADARGAGSSGRYRLQQAMTPRPQLSHAGPPE